MTIKAIHLKLNILIHYHYSLLQGESILTRLVTIWPMFMELSALVSTQHIEIVADFPRNWIFSNTQSFQLKSQHNMMTFIYWQEETTLSVVIPLFQLRILTKTCQTTIQHFVRDFSLFRLRILTKNVNFSNTVKGIHLSQNNHSLSQNQFILKRQVTL